MYLLLLSLLAAPVSDVLALLHRTVALHGVAMAPDGARVAWVEQAATPDGPSPSQSSVEVQELRPGAAPARVTAGGGELHDESEPVFSPDGLRLAFLSDAAVAHQRQLWVADLRSGAVRRLTDVKGHLAKPRFSPDGKAIAVLFIEGGGELAGPLAAAARPAGVAQEHVLEQRIAVVPADGSAPLRAVSPPDLFVYEYAWRPDGGAWVATGAPGSGDDNWWIARLWLVTPAKATPIYRPRLQICEPTWSPDGAQVAFIEGLMSDAGSNGGDVFVMPARAGAKPRNLTPGLRASASMLRWPAPGELLFAAAVEGDSAFFAAPLRGRPRLLWRGGESINGEGFSTGAAFSRDGSVSAGVLQGFTRAPEVVAGAPGAWRPLTQRNAGLESPAGAARSLRWKSDGLDVQGWLVSPPSPAPGSPLVVIVHGGPAGVVRSGWYQEALLLASQGYFVLLPNPRGSFGQGEAFTRANVKDFGYGDLRDILRGVDATLRAAPIDARRVGITGHSYGGYMTMWAVTQTGRFAAAVASAGIANWQSYYGENLIDQWMIPYFGKSVYDDPAVYARSSPITFIRRVRTPTLVLQGERDAEVPLPQAQEFWHALRTLGVETQLVVYPDEGHRLRQPAHVRDEVERTVGWFDAHLRR